MSQTGQGAKGDSTHVNSLIKIKTITYHKKKKKTILLISPKKNKKTRIKYVLLDGTSSIKIEEINIFEWTVETWGPKITVRVRVCF